MFSILAQIAINIYVLRGSLEDHPRSERSDTRVVIAGFLLPVVGALGLVPAIGFIYFLDASSVAYVAAIASGFVTSFGSQTLLLAGMHRVPFGSAAYLAAKLWFCGAAIGLLGIIHPIVPFFAACGFVAYKLAQQRSLNRLSQIADTL